MASFADVIPFIVPVVVVLLVIYVIVLHTYLIPEDYAKKPSGDVDQVLDFAAPPTAGTEFIEIAAPTDDDAAKLVSVNADGDFEYAAAFDPGTLDDDFAAKLSHADVLMIDSDAKRLDIKSQFIKDGDNHGGTAANLLISGSALTAAQITDITDYGLNIDFDMNRNHTEATDSTNVGKDTMAPGARMRCAYEATDGSCALELYAAAGDLSAADDTAHAALGSGLVKGATVHSTGVVEAHQGFMAAPAAAGAEAFTYLAAFDATGTPATTNVAFTSPKASVSRVGDVVTLAWRNLTGASTGASGTAITGFTDLPAAFRPAADIAAVSDASLGVTALGVISGVVAQRTDAALQLANGSISWVAAA